MEKWHSMLSLRKWETVLLCVMGFWFDVVDISVYDTCRPDIAPWKWVNWGKTCQRFVACTLSDSWFVWLMRGQLFEGDSVKTEVWCYNPFRSQLTWGFYITGLEKQQTRWVKQHCEKKHKLIKVALNWHYKDDTGELTGTICRLLRFPSTKDHQISAGDSCVI